MTLSSTVCVGNSHLAIAIPGAFITSKTRKSPKERGCSERYVRPQAVDGRLGKVFREAQVVETLKRAVKATVVCDGTSLIEIDVGMALQLVERKLVDVQFPWGRVLYDKIFLRVKREILDFIELIDAYIAPQALAVLNDLARKIRAYAWHGLQGGGIGRIQHDVLPLPDFWLIVGPDSITPTLTDGTPTTEGCITIDDLRPDIDRSSGRRWALAVSPAVSRAVARVPTRRKTIDGIGRNECIRPVILTPCKEDHTQGNDGHTEHREDDLAV